MTVSYIHLHGQEIANRLEDIAALRISVFREWPYLYEGTLDYERDYLQSYVNCEQSIIALALNDDKVVGATSGLPLRYEDREFLEPFTTRGLNPEEYFYFGESILTPEFRGKGIGKEFFNIREAFALSQSGITSTCFCAVDRAPDHPLRPRNYRPLDGFWLSRGYSKQDGFQARFRWKDIDEEDESVKSLTFWFKSWRK